MKKITVFLLALLLMLAGALPALADGEAQGMSSVAIIGDNLNDEQRSEVYRLFGIAEGTVPELRITFEEEKAYMQGKVPDEQLGSRSISSAYIHMMSESNGIQVSTHNITWCTQDMYIAALATAGVQDADIVIAAPFGVSGTAALAGIFKAYEELTGESLNEEAKDVAGEELVLTGQLSDVLGSEEAQLLMRELKGILHQIKGMSDEELRSTILTTADQFNIALTDEQVQQIHDLLRKMAELDLDPEELLKQAQNMQQAFENIAKAGEKTAGFFASIANFFNTIGSFFKNLFGIQ